MAAATKPSLKALLVRSTASLRHAVPPQTRLAALDISPTHVALALSDVSQQQAAPFGLLARTSPLADAKILRSALSAPSRPPLHVSGLVVGVSPAAAPDLALVDALLAEQVFPGLAGVLFFSEAHALRRAIRAQSDFADAMGILPDKLETRKLKRFAAAMNPRVAKEELLTDAASRARISATDLLQAVLDDVNSRVK